MPDGLGQQPNSEPNPPLNSVRRKSNRQPSTEVRYTPAGFGTRQVSNSKAGGSEAERIPAGISNPRRSQAGGSQPGKRETRERPTERNTECESSGCETSGSESSGCESSEHESDEDDRPVAVQPGAKAARPSRLVQSPEPHAPSSGPDRARKSPAKQAAAGDAAAPSGRNNGPPPQPQLFHNHRTVRFLGKRVHVFWDDAGPVMFCVNRVLIAAGKSVKNVSTLKSQLAGVPYTGDLQTAATNQGLHAGTGQPAAGGGGGLEVGCPLGSLLHLARYKGKRIAMHVASAGVAAAYLEGFANAPASTPHRKEVVAVLIGELREVAQVVSSCMFHHTCYFNHHLSQYSM